MKIVVTGSLGHISKPLVMELSKNGQDVTVISSDPSKQPYIESLGAKAAIGSVRDAGFLETAFSGADAVYTMVPPNNYMDQSLDLLAYYMELGRNYARAIAGAGVKRVVNLSSIGAHLESGSGIIEGAHNVEKLLNQLPMDVVITHLRPTSFYYNLYGYVPMIKKTGMIMANYGEEDVIPWVAPQDIALVVAEELVKKVSTRSVRYIASEELTGHASARIIGESIGIPGLQWKIIPGKQYADGLKAAGMNPQIADGLIEMYDALHTGSLSEDYFRNRPAVMGKIKLRDFAPEFAATFGNQ
ncbi:MAG: NAD(P)H-binding protein [Chitinophagaceae bacterium]|nr:NAD(P)H-binding protein [Chitinophagaceae bacterium]